MTTPYYKALDAVILMALLMPTTGCQARSSLDGDGGMASGGTGSSAGGRDQGMTGGTGSGTGPSEHESDPGIVGRPGTGSDRCIPPTLPERPKAITTVGDGTAASCTETALESALEAQGLIDFNCGPDAISIKITHEHYVRKDTWIDGGDRITFDGNHQTRMFRTEVDSITVFEKLRFVNGYSEGHDWETERGGGGAIYRGWMGKLYIVDCTFEDNEARDGVGGGAVSTDSGGLNVLVNSTFLRNTTTGTGGGFYSVLSDLYIVNSTFSDNHAQEFGGGISVDGAIDAPDQNHPERPGGPLEICGGRFERNTAAGSGGGATVYGWRSAADHTDKVLIEDSLFLDNELKGENGYGGGLYANSQVTIRNSTFARNHASTSGGGLWVNGDVSIENTTVFKNRSEYSGGGIAAQDGSMRLVHVTVAHNSTGTLYGGSGGVVSAPPDMIKLYANDTIIAWNNVDEGGWVYNCMHGFEGAGNIEYLDPALGDPSALAQCRDNFTVADPLFADELAENGGPVPTLAIAATSVAASSGMSCTGTDARGEPRPMAACAAGSYQP